ncbi:hypothetical protein J7E93_27715 [Streptomyces sp. ISL-36]|uniref:hypothetical protein n=1 Tax=Streptomyces sp. ISL-36 TaxID=2819182 RepID=UPI001BEC760E|nr:hypothetical protein [Streptomyces sp. ISL-36]MBT2443818.1 hypothetical protein [Streptomyces sp. ISL-36]
MRAARTLAVAATAFAAVGLAAPLAAATNGPSSVTVGSSVVQRGGDDSNSVTVTPFAVHQGSTLTITVRGCSGGTVSSAAFPTTTLSANSNNVSSAVVRIHNNATLGQHTLTVHCNNSNRVLTQQFRVLAGQGSQGGIGGSLAPSSTEMAVGGSLVAAAALGGGLFIARRRRIGAAV